MKCPKCNVNLIKVEVDVEGARNKAISYQCEKCDYLDFEKESSNKILLELKAKENPLKIKQKIVKLSQDRLGTYFNKNIIRSLDLKAGEDIYVSTPDKKHILITIEENKK